jgi:hypothetical protein
MRIWENRVPETVTLPSDRVDWNAKVADECIVDTWALAKISRIPAVTQGSGASSKSSSSMSSLQTGTESSLSLISRLQGLEQN